MPCRGDDGPSPSEYNASMKKIRENENNLTRMLCEVMSALTSSGFDLHIDGKMPTKQVSPIYKWYDSHKDWDKKRLAAAKESALAKLSDEEKEALGLE